MRRSSLGLLWGDAIGVLCGVLCVGLPGSHEAIFGGDGVGCSVVRVFPPTDSSELSFYLERQGRAIGGACGWLEGGLEVRGQARIGVALGWVGAGMLLSVFLIASCEASLGRFRSSG